MRFSGVMIGSEDSHTLAAFYTRVLGDPEIQDGDWYGWADGAQLMLGHHSDVHGKNLAPERVMLTFEVGDVLESFATLRTFGATVVAEPYQPDGGEGSWLATLEDPDGNYVQLATPWTQ